MDIDLKLYDDSSNMTEELWKQVKYFDKNENWGNPYKMKIKLIYLLDRLRMIIGHPFHINCGYELFGHAMFSEHEKGNAVDLYCKYISVQDLFFEALKFPFNGIGIYFNWNNKGLHLDNRLLKYGESKHLWYCKETGIYKPLTLNNLFNE